VTAATQQHRSETLPGHSPPPAAPREPGSALRAAERLARRIVVSSGCGLNRMLGSRAGRRFGILMYHRVAHRVSGVEPPTWNVTPADFRAQLAGLLDRGFRAWPLSRLIAAHRAGGDVPPRTFAITFDDGQESVYRHAWPILKELDVPATLFLPTAWLDGETPFPFDDWSAAGSQGVPLESWRPMTSRQCREIAADGLVELGAHTHTHQDFYARSNEFAADLATNVDVLRSSFGVREPSFAFPFGRATPEMMNAVRFAGLSCGLTTASVLVDPRDEPFGWGRFNVESWDTAATLAAKLGGWCSWGRTLRRPLARLRRPELI
jgi:peptidoglycan/xylan/chitin deacetylase (PgdA/CDA1 family)